MPVHLSNTILNIYSWRSEKRMYIAQGKEDQRFDDHRFQDEVRDNECLRKYP